MYSLLVRYSMKMTTVEYLISSNEYLNLILLKHLEQVMASMEDTRNGTRNVEIILEAIDRAIISLTWCVNSSLQ